MHKIFVIILEVRLSTICYSGRKHYSVVTSPCLSLFVFALLRGSCSKFWACWCELRREPMRQEPFVVWSVLSFFTLKKCFVDLVTWICNYRNEDICYVFVQKYIKYPHLQIGCPTVFDKSRPTMIFGKTNQLCANVGISKRNSNTNTRIQK